MHSKSTFSANVIHTKKMICSLTYTQTTEKIRGNATICPKYIPIIGIYLLS